MKCFRNEALTGKSYEKSCQFFTFIFKTHAKCENVKNVPLERDDTKCYFRELKFSIMRFKSHCVAKSHEIQLLTFQFAF